MAIDRLAQVEKHLTRLQEQLAGLENAMILAAPADKVRCRQQIEDLRLEMRPFQEEFKQLANATSNGDPLDLIPQENFPATVPSSPDNVLQFRPPLSRSPVGAVTAEKIAALIQSSEASGVPDLELAELRLLLSQLRSGEALVLSPQITVEENPLPGGDRELYYATGRVENLGNSHPYFL